MINALSKKMEFTYSLDIMHPAEREDTRDIRVQIAEGAFKFVNEVAKYKEPIDRFSFTAEVVDETTIQFKAVR